jgi:hypothetical protein
MGYDLDPVTWEQFKVSLLNASGSDEEAKAMFAAGQAEIEGRDWTWYLRIHDSDREAKAAWVRQRLRYGLPIPQID